VILSDVRDPRLVTIRRGGTLTDDDHALLALWAADCAEHVLHLFAAVRPDDQRPRRAIGSARAWARGEITMTRSRAAGQAAVVAHVAAHELGAAAYAIKAVRAAARVGEADEEGRAECAWQRDRLPAPIRELVLDDQRLRNDLCWSVFDP
jgi:hypothetical protein